jgi:hypothetical protein
MQTKRIKIQARDGSDMDALAQLMICEECSCESFHIYSLDGHSHPHLQCCECGATYCTGGKECALVQPPIDTSTYKCRACGCTDGTACVDGRGQSCHWVAENLCSACAGPANQPGHASAIILPGDPRFAV